MQHNLKTTARAAAQKARKQEARAIRLYNRGVSLREIKRRTTVDSFIVRGLVFAQNLKSFR